MIDSNCAIKSKKIHVNKKYLEWKKKFFKSQYVNGKWEDWWDTAHPDLISTKTIQFGYSKSYCIYCGEIAKSIQAGLRNEHFLNFNRNYSVTGYTCCCIGAYKEATIRKSIENLKDKHNEKLRKLKDMLPKANIKKLIKLKINQIKKFDRLEDFMKEEEDDE